MQRRSGAEVRRRHGRGARADLQRAARGGEVVRREVLVRGGGDVDTPRRAVGAHARGGVDRVADEVVLDAPVADDARDGRARVDAHLHGEHRRRAARAAARAVLAASAAHALRHLRVEHIHDAAQRQPEAGRREGAVDGRAEQRGVGQPRRHHVGLVDGLAHALHGEGLGQSVEAVEGRLQQLEQPARVRALDQVSQPHELGEEEGAPLELLRHHRRTLARAEEQVELQLAQHLGAYA